MLLRKIISEQLLATPAGTAFDLGNPLFFNILAANPLLARFYVDLFRRHGANPGIIKDLETRSAIFFSRDQSTRNPTPNHRKVQTWQSIPTLVSALTSRSTESAAARHRCAWKSSAI